MILGSSASFLRYHGQCVGARNPLRGHREVGVAVETWYYNVGGTVYGPVPEVWLRQQVVQGSLGLSVLVWREGMRDWVPASVSFGMSAVPIQQASPPPPPPASVAVRQKPKSQGGLIAALIISVLLIACAGLNLDDSGSSEPAESSSAESAESSSEYANTRDYKTLKSGGMTEDQAVAYLSAADRAKVGGLTGVVSRKDIAAGQTLFVLSCNDEDVGVQYTALFKGPKLEKIVDKNSEQLWAYGKVNADYLYWADIGGAARAQAVAKDVILQRLKAPSTAEFPGGLLDPSSGWGMSKKGNRVTVQSYVDSQNSFGAQLRSPFTVVLEIIDGKAHVKYVKLGGEVLQNELK